MPKIEVEHRGILTEKKFKELNRFFRKEGKFLDKKDRFSIIYFVSKKKVKRIAEMKNVPIDLKLRITNKKTELGLKYGKWGGKDARKEFLFPINSSKFDEMVEFLKILGFHHGVLNTTKTYFYKYRGIEFALVKVPNWGYYFEAEMMVNKNDIKKANKKIVGECERLNLKVLNDDELCKLLDDLNNRKGYKFNFKKQKFSDIKKRFIDYF